MKFITTVLAVLSLFVVYSSPAIAQDEDCWHYENGDAPIVGAEDTPGEATNVAVRGSYAYVADGGAVSDKVLVIDVSNPENPWTASSFLYGGHAYDIAISGHYAYTALGDLTGQFGLLYVVDVADPLNPEVGEFYFCEEKALSVVVSHGFAYLGLGDLFSETGIVIIVNVSNPDDLFLVGQVEVSGPCRGVAVRDNVGGQAEQYVFVVDELGLKVIDVSDPGNPVIAGSADTPGIARDVAVTDDLAYVADSNGLFVLDVSDLESIQFIGFESTTGPARGVTISSGFAYVVDEIGLVVIDIDDSTNPQILGSVETPGDATAVTIADNGVYVADWESGLQILPVQCESIVGIEDGSEQFDPNVNVPAIDMRLAVHPNPFNPQTMITFALERDEWAAVAVYELTGRRVTELASREFTAGNHSVVWNGRDSQGRAVPSGTYVVRLETESTVEARKVMLIR